MTHRDVSAAQLAWDRQSVWSQTANRLKDRLVRTRVAALVLTVAAAVLALAGSQLLSVSHGWGRGLAFAAAVAVGVTPLVRSATGVDRVGDWIQARSIAETMKAEVYLYLTGSGHYHGPDRDAVLDDELDRLERDAGSLDAHTAGVAAVHRALPDVRDVTSYVELRLRPQIDRYYRPQADVQRRRLRVAWWTQTGLAVVAAVLAAAAATYGRAGLAAWVSVITTVTTAIAAHAAAQRYAVLQIEYTRTADELSRLLHRRARLSGPAGAPLTDGEFIRQCEQVISVQNDKWMAKVGSNQPDPTS